MVYDGSAGHAEKLKTQGFKGIAGVKGVTGVLSMLLTFSFERHKIKPVLVGCDFGRFKPDFLFFPEVLRLQFAVLSVLPALGNNAVTCFAYTSLIAAGVLLFKPRNLPLCDWSCRQHFSQLR